MVPGLGKGDVMGQPQKTLRSDLEGRAPEMAGNPIPSGLDDFGQIGHFHQIGIAVEIDADTSALIRQKGR
jgi:hypothetical protein